MADFVKDPQASLLYVMDHSAALPSGATITDSSWSISGPDGALTLDSASILSGSLKTQVRLVGGTADRDYVVTNTITISGTPTQINEKSFTIAIRQR